MADRYIKDWDQYYMSIACLAALRSKDPRVPVGACIVTPEKRVVGIGYNCMPDEGRDLKDPEKPCEEWKWGSTCETTEKMERDMKYPYIVHAAKNAILNRTTSSLKGCTLYVTLCPDEDCAQAIIQSGITSVKYSLMTASDNMETRQEGDIKRAKELLRVANVCCSYYNLTKEPVVMMLTTELNIQPPQLVKKVHLKIQFHENEPLMDLVIKPGQQQITKLTIKSNHCDDSKKRNNPKINLTLEPATEEPPAEEPMRLEEPLVPVSGEEPLAEKPPVPAEKPPIPAEEPTVPAEEPPVPAEEPQVPAEEPQVPEEEPQVPAEESRVPAEEQPVSAEEQPVSAEEQPAPAKEQPAPAAVKLQIDPSLLYCKETFSVALKILPLVSDGMLNNEANVDLKIKPNELQNLIQGKKVKTKADGVNLENGLEVQLSTQREVFSLKQRFDKAKELGPKSKDDKAEDKILTPEQFFMAIAMLSAMKEGEHERRPDLTVGACIVTEDTSKEKTGRKPYIHSVGFSGYPDHWNRKAVQEAEKSPYKKGDPYICHAECRAILNEGTESVDGCTLYVTKYPCNECAQVIVQSGIKKVFYYEDAFPEDSNYKKYERSKDIFARCSKIKQEQFTEVFVTLKEITVKREVTSTLYPQN